MRQLKWLLVLGVVVLAGWSARSLFPKAETAWFLWQENERLKRDMSALEREKEATTEKLNGLTIPRRVEQEAKLRLQLRKPGEEVVVIVGQDKASSTPVLAGEMSFWSRMWASVRQFSLPQFP